MRNLKELRITIREKTRRNREEEDSLKIARDSVFSFASAHQEPIRTYLQDSESVFDLKQETSGAIFRLTADINNLYGNGEPNGKIDFWFVKGTESSMDIFLVSHKDPREAMYSAGPILRVGRSFNTKKIDLGERKTEFPISEAVAVLLKGTVYPEYFARMLTPVRLDVMVSGKRRRFKRKVSERVSLPIPSLQPVYERGII